jgi:lipid-A-disaccharide synthase
MSGPRSSGPALTLFLVAGEHSGDALGARLVAALKARHDGAIRFSGVGGELMAAEGLSSLFPLSDVAVMGPLAILRRLVPIVRRVHQTVDAAISARPDAVVIIDSPEFTHPIAKRIRRRQPDIPILDYVSPTVWAWRPGRARKMAAYIDHVLALLPFEPDAHRRLGGPPCSYVGHPLIERLDYLAHLDPHPLARRLGLAGNRPVLVLLPGSRLSEVSRLLDVFEATVDRIAAGQPLEIVMPVVSSVRSFIEDRLASWPIRPHVVDGEDDKWRAFKLARAALAASGTVTLELALAGVPMAVAYRVDPLAAPFLRRMIKAPSVVLANLVLGENVIPEFLQEDCTPDRLADALRDLLAEGPARQRQLAAMTRIPDRLAIAASTPSEAAAGIVLDHATRRIPNPLPAVLVGRD